ncbi:MAG: PTS transporter subunit EIIB, partial [Clostridiaceae bacterium]
TETSFIDIDKNGKKTQSSSKVKPTDDDMASRLILGLGGRENIDNIDYCATRLRVKINDINKIDRDEIIEAGAINMIKVGNENIQIIIGQRVQFIFDAINKLLNNGN